MNRFFRYLAVAAMAHVASTTAAAEPDDFSRLPAEAKDMAGFVPAGWTLIKNADGDLNKDGLSDVAGVLERKTEIPDPAGDGPPRILFVAFQKPGGGYRLSVQANRAILRSGEGGAFGDPFELVKVERGSLHVSFYGGSSERWSYTYQFRFQNGAWFLIGVTTQTSRTDGSDEGTYEDFNLLTGRMRTVTTDAKGKNHEKMINRGKRKLVNLVNFEAAADAQSF
jgi:hypothetical protein